MLMPYITFSRNFINQRAAKRSLEKKPMKDSIVELRGEKNIEDLVRMAVKNGFKKILVLTNMNGGTAAAQEINISRNSPFPKWKFGKEKKIKVA